MATLDAALEDSGVPDCGYLLGTSVSSAALPDAKTLPECTIDGLCAAARSQNLDPGVCSSGSIDGYYVFGCADSHGIPLNTIEFCNRNWSDLKNACKIGELALALYENCAGFDIAVSGGLHVISQNYYDHTTGQLVGALTMFGIEGIAFYSVAGVQLPPSAINAISSCPAVTCGS